MNAPQVFFDTNVLLYALDPQDPEKQRRAADWIDAAWRAQTIAISWQVLHEFYANATRKRLMHPVDARQAVTGYSEWRVEPWGMPLLRRAWHWCDAAQLSFWDAMIVAAAEQAGARLLVTEDLQAGRRFGQVLVVNPFEGRPEDFVISSPSALA